MIKVLQMITELELGGAQLIILNFLREFDSSKFRNYLISSPTGLLVDKAKNIKNIEIFLTSFLKRSINPIFDLLAFFSIYRYIKKNKIDIVHTHSSKAGILGRWAAKIAGVDNIIHTYHGFGFNNRQKWITKNFFLLLEKITSLITDKLIFVSKNNFDKAGKLGIGSKKKNILIYEGIRKKRFLNSFSDSDKIRNKLGVKNKDKLVGMIGPLKPQKSPLDFVRVSNLVLKEFYSVKFFIVGDGYLRPEVEKEIEKLNLQDNVFLLGWRRDIEKLMNSLDVVVLTSYWEGLPHSLLEAMFCQKPVVAYAVDGVCEIIKDGVNGYKVSPGNIRLFAKKVINLLKDEELADNMGRAGARWMENKFDLKSTIYKTERLYKNLLK